MGIMCVCVRVCARTRLEVGHKASNWKNDKANKRLDEVAAMVDISQGKVVGSREGERRSVSVSIVTLSVIVATSSRTPHHALCTTTTARWKSGCNAVTITATRWPGGCSTVTMMVARWSGVTMTTARWPGVTMTTARWSGVTMTTARWPGVTMTTARWTGVTMTTARWSGVTMTTARWQGGCSTVTTTTV